MTECGTFYSTSIKDSGTLILGVVVGYARKKYYIYDSMWKCSILFEKTTSEQMTSINGIKNHLKNLNTLLDIDKWASNGATMIAFCVYLNNLEDISQIPKEVNVTSIREKIIEKRKHDVPTIVKTVSTNINRNNNNNHQNTNEQKLNINITENIQKKKKT